MLTSRSVRAAVIIAALAVVATPVANAAAKKPAPKPKWHTLTVTAPLSQTEQSTVDSGAPGRTKGDIYVLSAPVRDASGAVIGHYDLACTITDEDAGDGTARALCKSATVLDRRGEIDAVGLAVLVPSPAAGTTLGVLPREAEFAVVGGTGEFTGAHGTVVTSRSDTVRTLRYRYRRG